MYDINSWASDKNRYTCLHWAKKKVQIKIYSTGVIATSLAYKHGVQIIWDWSAVIHTISASSSSLYVENGETRPRTCTRASLHYEETSYDMCRGTNIWPLIGSNFAKAALAWGSPIHVITNRSRFSREISECSNFWRQTGHAPHNSGGLQSRALLILDQGQTKTGENRATLATMSELKTINTRYQV